MLRINRLQLLARRIRNTDGRDALADASALGYLGAGKQNVATVILLFETWPAARHIA